MYEREVKLPADERFELPDLNDMWEGAAAMPRGEEHLSTVYLDSDDRRLARWGVSLRYRDGQGWTLKLPSDEPGAALVRDELVFQGTPETAPTEAVDLVTGYTRGRPLRPQARLSTLRGGVQLRDAQGHLLADVVNDAVSVLDAHPAVDHFRELEVEVRPETPDGLLEEVVSRLREAGAGAPDPTPKYLRAIGGPDAATPEVTEPHLSSSASLGQVVAHAIGDGVTRLVRHDAVVRLDTDPEGVHQARVATRRLRSDLRTFRASLDRQWTRALREELGWFGTELGAARDADVLLARLSARAQTLPDASREGARELTDALEPRRRDAHTAMLAAMRSERYAILLDRLIAAAQAPALLEGEDDRRAAKALPPLVRKNWRALKRRVKSLGETPTDEELHAVRILAKRCRYAAEASAPVLGKRARRLARAAAELQDTLGELRDAVAAEAWLREWAKHQPSTRAAFAAGELAMLERAAASRARKRWPRAWKRAKAAARA